MNPEECSERIDLIDAYGKCVSDYSRSLTALQQANGANAYAARGLSNAKRIRCEEAWQAVERHIAQHGCLASDAWKEKRVLDSASDAALDVILVANDARCYVDLNQAAVEVLGLPREKIIGRRIDEFFAEAQGESVPAAWDSFIGEGQQSGICELFTGTDGHRRFNYRAKANFLPGLHLSILREMP